MPGTDRVGNNHLGVNQSFTKFLFVTPVDDSESNRTCLRAAGNAISRGFFNDYNANGSPASQASESIQFLVSASARDDADPVTSARYVVQVCANYRSRLEDIEADLRRRTSDQALIYTLNGAVQAPRYTSAELYAFAYKGARGRSTGRTCPNAIIIPIKKTPDWWAKDGLDRHAYFYPHEDRATQASVKGHARAAEAGITTLFYRLYHNPDGYQREGEFDFITYVESTDEHLTTFDHVRCALRDEQQNPEWRYVLEGAEWRGHRVLRW